MSLIFLFPFFGKNIIVDLFYLGIGLLLGGLIIYVFTRKKKTTTISTSASVLLEKIESVSKLVTIEGNFSEVIHFIEEKPRWLSLLPNHKKAIVIVKAKAMVGFDLKKAAFEVDPSTQTLTINKLPQPEILSIEPELEYYDIKESALNKFKPADHSSLQKEARALIRKKVEEGELFKLAIERGKGQLTIIKELAQINGWKVASPVKELN